MKKIFLIIIILLVSSCKASSITLENQVCFKDSAESCFNVELAVTDEELQRGLQFRGVLFEHAGMLFVFKQAAQHAFWMKNTLLPLDMIWLDNEGVVVHIEQNAPPCKTDNCAIYQPESQANYVLEVNAGLCEKLGIAIGDKTKINIDL
ncbi:MAG: DUF192 domain-containing protein [Candidatus Zapsychrus exili]|nr:DUF192 domain-containing protein [Candidatus Zapsychrus exili]